MSSLIEAVDVRRSFPMGARTLDVLRGVSLAVAEGESLAISGMSGAGKSTLLHVMGGLDRPTAGRVLYRGRDLYAAGTASGRPSAPGRSVLCSRRTTCCRN